MVGWQRRYVGVQYISSCWREPTGGRRCGLGGGWRRIPAQGIIEGATALSAHSPSTHRRTCQKHVNYHRVRLVWEKATRRRRRRRRSFREENSRPPPQKSDVWSTRRARSIHRRNRFRRGKVVVGPESSSFRG